MSGTSANDALRSLIGTWRDQQRATYELTLERTGISISVKRVRPNGETKFTQRLIRLERESGLENVVELDRFGTHDKVLGT